MTPVHYLSIGELQEAFRQGTYGPVDVTEAALERIAEVDPKLKAFITVTGDVARRQAELAEREMRADGPKSPLHGVPIALKDLCDTAGIATTGGSMAWKDRVPGVDATVVRRLADAGAILLGKLAMTEGAFIEHAPGMPEPVNPWRAGHMTGLSSSGPGVATAAGLAYGTLGSDTGGSIRFPSALCGVTGLKPTWGRVSRAGILPLAESLDHIGAMTRTVADAAAVLGVIAGHDPADPTSLTAKVPDYVARIARTVKGVRIGIDEAYCTDGVDPELRDSVIGSVAVFQKLGAEVKRVTMPSVEAFIAHFSDMVSIEADASNAEALLPGKQQLGPVYRGVLERGSELSAKFYAQLRQAALRYAGGLQALFEDVDLILCPSWPTPAVEITADALGDVEDQGGLLRFTGPFNFSGSPTLSIPSGFNADGLPLGLQLVGRHLEEEVLCRVGHAYQQATDWHKRFPPV
jgi:amidase